MEIFLNKAQLLKRLSESWDEFRASYAGLSEAEMVVLGVSGEWSIKDVIAHVTTWEQEALKYLPVILEGKKPPRYSVAYGGIDAFNALMYRRKRALSLQEILQQQERVHRQLLEYLNEVGEDQFARQTKFHRRLRLDTYQHYREHAEAIRKWREQRLMMNDGEC